MEQTCVRCGLMLEDEGQLANSLCLSCAKGATTAGLDAAIDFARLNAAKRKRRALRDALASEPRKAE